MFIVTRCNFVSHVLTRVDACDCAVGGPRCVSTPPGAQSFRPNARWSFAVVMFYCLPRAQDSERQQHKRCLHLWYEAGSKEAFEIKIKGHLGEADDCEKEIRVLNRICRLDKGGIYYEAGPRHVEMLLKALPVSASMSSPGVRGISTDDAAVLDELVQQDTLADAVDPDHSPADLPVATIREAGRPRVVLDDVPVVHQILDGWEYASIYCKHPRHIFPTRHAKFKTATDHADVFTGKSKKHHGSTTLTHVQRTTCTENRDLPLRALEHYDQTRCCAGKRKC